MVFLYNFVVFCSGLVFTINLVTAATANDPTMLGGPSASALGFAMGGAIVLGVFGMWEEFKKSLWNN